MTLGIIHQPRCWIHLHGSANDDQMITCCYGLGPNFNFGYHLPKPDDVRAQLMAFITEIPQIDVFLTMINQVFMLRAAYLAQFAM